MKYFDYIKDNPHHLWFKRKLYGWGWTPATWQGWVAVLGYIVFIGLLTVNLEERSSGRDVLLKFIVPVLLGTIALILLAYRTGEKPRWQWGEPKK